MVSLWWGQSALDELIEKATSELLPANQTDLALQFTISDQIRSKAVNARDAMRAFKRRLEHKNPNVQLLTLSLLDTCVKNSGYHFVREIASSEFMDALMEKLNGECNQEVKAKILSVIQVWALSVQNYHCPSLSYLTETYNLLRIQKFEFPPLDTQNINPIFLESETAPEWTDSDVCERCRTQFTFTNRKHHCRNCGGTFCQECSSKTLPLPHYGIDDHVRVCHGCYAKLKLSRIAKKHAIYSSAAAAAKTPSLVPAPPPAEQQSTQRDVISKATESASTWQAASIRQEEEEDKQFEEDLAKAIELSKKEAEQRWSSSQWKQEPPVNEEDDPDLAAAIAASLRDLEQSQDTGFYSHQFSRQTINPDDLSPLEMENIELFSVLMERIHASGRQVSSDEQVNHLYTQIGALQPKLLKSLDSTITKYRKLVETHEKLNQAIRTYDQFLEQRISGGFQRNPVSYAQSGSTAYPQNIVPPPQLLTAVSTHAAPEHVAPSGPPLNVPATTPQIPHQQSSIPYPAIYERYPAYAGRVPTPAGTPETRSTQEQQPHTAPNSQSLSLYPQVPTTIPQQQTCPIEDAPLIEL